ncbi:MAG TPA: hypothetical protein VK737_08470 [Opitutales bacterium]|jgi:hypothetical protein|nr:hypothetical protein [Opitutales bacterium]
MRVFPFLLFVASATAALAQAPADANATVKHDFTVYDPNYQTEWTARAARLSELKTKLMEQASTGVKNPVAQQILFEAGTLLLSTADFKRIDRRTDDLVAAMDHPSLDKQDADGMWGSGSEQWFLKLDNTFSRFSDDARNLPDGPPRPLPAFLDRVSTPAKLTVWLDAIATSDVQHTGIDHGLEFNLTISDLVRMLILGEPENFKIDPALRDAFLDLLKNKYRDPKTGFWGERFQHDGQVDFQPDISTTFHIISYLHGDVPDMPRVADSLLAVKDLNDPAGWLSSGHYWNHNNMDVVTVFAYAWPTASAAQRQAMSTEIGKMVDWCLKESLQPDGSFKTTIGDLSQEYAEYFGVEFLDEAGYFSSTKRFWTDRNFPEAAAMKQKIIDFIKQHNNTGVSGDSYQESLAELSHIKD